ncbi:hypothetical protein Tco_1085779 [Tanacetum coccineum]
MEPTTCHQLHHTYLHYFSSPNPSSLAPHENANVSYVYMLPPELFDRLVSELPPLALQNLQDAMQLVSSGDCVLSDDGFTPSRKRKRYEIFDIAWKVLYVSRWVPPQKSPVDINWQQLYREKHLQICLDATWRAISDTSFNGFLGDVHLPGNFY